MEWLIITGIIIWLIVWWADRSAKRKRRLDYALERLNVFERRLDRVERRIAVAVQAAAPTAAEPVAAVSPASVEADAPFGRHTVAEEAAPTKPTPGLDATPEPASLKIPAVAIKPTPPPALPSPLQERWRRIEHMFIENWTGILGVVVVVAGVTFIGIYTALQLAPVYRFLIMVGVAGALVGASVFLGRREPWQALAQWVRSAGAAIFLFACAASGGLPGLGLQWIDATTPALALLLLGMAANLYLAWAGGTQTFASLHVILSLLPLAIVPQSAMSLSIASVVALFGVLLSLRARWDQHLLIVIGTYFLYHVSWYLRLGDAMQLPEIRFIGAFGAIVVFAAAALVHYRKDYASQKPEHWPLLVHISNWALLALALLVYPNESAMCGLALALGGVIAYLLARRARPLGVRWLYLCDTLIGQTLMVAALVSLYPLIANLQLALLAIFLETVLFLRLVIDEGEEFLGRVGWYSANFAGVLFAVGGVYVLVAEADLRNQNALILLVGAATATAVHLYLTRKHGEKLRTIAGDGLSQAVMGWLVGIIVIVALLNLMEGAWMETAALLSAGGLLFVSRAMSPPGLLTGTGAAVIATHVMSWQMLLLHMPWEAAPLAQQIGPLIALAALTIWIVGSGVLRQVAIYLLGLDAGLAVYLFFNPVSPLIPGVAWLLLSLLALELANRLKRPSATSTLLLGYAYLVAFVGAYALVTIQTPGYLGLVRARMVIEFFGLGVILYWWLYYPRQTLREHPAWLRAHPFFLEFGLIAITVTNIVEVPAQWRPLVWSLLGLALLTEPLVRRDGRFRMYSLIFYWVSVANVAVIMSVFESPSPRWYDRSDIMSLIAIALQIVYIVVSPTGLALADIRFPDGLGALGRLGKLITARRNLWVYYPFFVGVALFLFWRFDRSVLTLLWAAEAFAVFVLSGVLRENQFRYVALAGLAICLVRLLLIDMAEANLGLRGLVFIGVGLLMLGMNAIYNRYRARFQ